VQQIAGTEQVGLADDHDQQAVVVAGCRRAHVAGDRRVADAEAEPWRGLEREQRPATVARHGQQPPIAGVVHFRIVEPRSGPAPADRGPQVLLVGASAQVVVDDRLVLLADRLETQGQRQASGVQAL